MSTISPDNFAFLTSIAATLLVLILLTSRTIQTSLVKKLAQSAQSMSQKPVLLLILIPAASFLVNTLIGSTKGIPQPLIQDEHSYLLAADTFVHRRVTNPSPPFSEHFETPHELMHPTYMSKYPPAQGISLALGQAVTGLPIVGVWMTTAAACAMIYWMLLGFLPPPWAMLGGWVAVVNPQLILWSQNYWGGSVAMLGGAMVLGAWIRLMSKATALSTLILGMGLAILANSRPFEGLILVIPLLFTFIPAVRARSVRSSLLGTHRVFTQGYLQIAIPLSTVLVPVAVAMGYYNFRVTGHPFHMPFAEYSAQYDIYPKFWFLPKRPAPEYHNDSLRDIHTVFERGEYDRLRSPAGLFSISAHRLWMLITLTTRPWQLLVPFIFGCALLWDRWLRWVWITLAVFLVGLCSENFFLPHYASPMVAGLLLITVAGWKKLAECHRFGQVLSTAIIFGVFTGCIVALFAPTDRDSQRAGHHTITENLPIGKHLIFVQYTAGHLMHDEWVYNGADITTARIIWARCLGPSQDAPVAEHFTGREIWLLRVGQNDVHLLPYPLPK